METVNIGQIERETQNRIVRLFKDKLDYTYLGNWEDRENNSNIEEEYLIKFLKKQKYSDILIKKALNQLRKVAGDQTLSLYDLNKEIYSKLRYGIKVKEDISQHKKTVWLIDWNNPLKNDFYIAEEVTINGKYTKRPDIVLYVNGIAVGVLELKRSTVSVSEGIRQNLDNQTETFIKQFFGTVQLVMAGNDTEGFRYGTTETPERYYLKWKEELDIRNKLDRDISLVCNKERIIELIHDFIVFDAGIKKICRHNQYFGVKASQEALKKREGGIIWHTQGSGKSLTMIWLAKWIHENIQDSRVLIITDRTELDGQIEKFFKGVDEEIHRTNSGRDLIKVLMKTDPWLICSLVHKFGRNSEKYVEDYLKDLKSDLKDNFKVQGDVYVFVDECHRTQSGKLHNAMKEILPNAVFIGFTGTPLLKKNKKKSIEVFGKYLHTYKFDQAVEDEVVLDLQYEARKIDQKLTSKDYVDKWFEAKTKGLTDFAKAELKKKWGTMQKVLSSESRLKRIVSDILLDFEIKPRLSDGSGNAILVAGSIYQACKYYELFQKAGLKKCAIITSYDPNIAKIKGESTGDDSETENIRKYKIYQDMLNGKDPEVFEEEVKRKFIKEPGQMKLLIVVDKLLTGFDAPPATYLYIDKHMQDHGLFQAICRVNRLYDQDKDYGYVIDYKDLFKSLDKAVKNYTSEAFENFDADDVKGLLKDRLETCKENLDSAREAIKELCEPVAPPKDSISFQHYFCGKSENPEDLKNTERKRKMLYKLSAKYIRAFANLANEMEDAGYSKKEINTIKGEVVYYERIRDEIKRASGDYIDLKAYEASMRHLIDTYVEADPSKKISEFDDLTLIDLIVKKGESALDSLPETMRKNKESTAETIENNVRRLIVEERPSNPKYYDNMSTLLDELIEMRKQENADYEAYLKKAVELVKKVKNPSNSKTYPKELDSRAKKALYDNLDRNIDLALEVDKAILSTKQDSWRGNSLKKKAVKRAVAKVLAKHGINDEKEVDEVFKIILKQNEY